VLASGGPERVTELLDLLEQHAHRHGIQTPFSSTTPYVNTIPAEEQPPTRATWRSRSASAR
jgi:pyruvate dehydrogenase E1 component